MRKCAVMLVVLPLLGLGCKSPLRQLFVYSSGSSSRTGLATTEDGVVLGTESGSVIRLTLHGHQVWRTELGPEVAATPAVTPDAVVAATVDGEWVGLAAPSGKEKWRLSGQLPVFTPIVSDGYRAFLTPQDGSVSAVDSATGVVLWKHPAPREFRTGQERRAFPTPSLSESRLIVPLREAGLFALDPTTGKLLWSQNLRNVVGLTMDRDRVIAVTATGKVSALSAKDGEEIWKAAIGSPATSDIALALGYLWVGLENNELVALNAETGRELWRTVTPGPMTAALVEYNHVVVVPTNSGDGILRGLSPGKTAPLWETRLDSHLRSRPVCFPSRFLIMARDGRVFGFQVID